MKKIAGIIAAGFFSLALHAQNTTVKNAPGKQDVDKLCGCFEVQFKYAETFSPNPSYKFHDREEISDALELTMPIEVTDKKIVMQHLLVITDSVIVKHWREEWSYENPTVWNYQGDKVWTKQLVSADAVKGKWTQTVWEVSDEPRYQGFSQWVNLDGKTIWQSTADAPLPRREYTQRSDYNILKRTNRINITDTGYIHEQDNQKVLRKDGKDQLIAEEKGINSYKRVADKECASAKLYWEKNKAFWTKVRSNWEAYINTHNTISLKTKVDGKMLNEYLFALAKDYASKKISDKDIDARINTEIQRFMGTDDKSVAQQ